MGAVHRMPSCSKIIERGMTNCFIDSFTLRPKFASALPKSPAALERLLHGVAGLTILRRGSHVTEVLHERAHVARDGHLVIVEDDHHGRLRLADVVERFERHTARQGPRRR